jgi:hypothetical protein
MADKWQTGLRHKRASLLEKIGLTEGICHGMAQ